MRYALSVHVCLGGLLGCLGLLALPAAAQEPALLWEIGKADGHTRDLALGPKGYRRFSEDGYFVVGRSDAQRDWPYVHPGPNDAWAGGRAHTFTILFALKQAPQGACRLRFHLVDTHYGHPPRLRIEVNGTPFTHATPAGGPEGDASIEGNPAKGKAYAFDVAFEAALLEAGDNEISITNDAGSWLVYDWLGLEAPQGAALTDIQRPLVWIGPVRSLPVLFGDADAPEQAVQIPLRYFGDTAEAVVRITGAAPVTATLEGGTQTLEVRVPAVKEEQQATVTLEVAGAVAGGPPPAKAGAALYQREVMLRPVRRWVVYMMHHTHLDIGYTHLQSDVEKIQWQHIEKAIELADATKEYPPEARFKWLPEGLWAVDSYLEQATPEQRARFIDAVRAGSIGLDALYGNELTALCRPEELLELTGYARRLAQEYGLTIDTAMISDVPGYTWGLVPVLAQSGVKYLSIGPNAGHRIGYTLSEWGDKPFYWVSPSGKERVLCWVAAKAYSWFHRGPIKDAQPILDYLAELDQAGFPYDHVPIRYNIGGDNGPPDPNLPDFVRDWNAKHAYPKLIIATTKEAFAAVEEHYADRIPEVRGDFTPYWEDGAGSSARETAINRAAAERLVQANALWAMLDPGHYPAEDFHAAWREAILYDEHTWGAHNSISEPESDFAVGQWKIKQAFALEADRQSRAVLDRVLAGRKAEGDIVAAVEVFNTGAQPRTDLVVLPRTWKLAGGRVLGPDGKAASSQRLSTGELAFLAENVPPMGGARFSFHDAPAKIVGRAQAEGAKLSNGLISVELNRETGAIAELTRDGIDANFVNRNDGLGLNDYFYVQGRDPKRAKRNDAVTITVKDPGPLVASVLVSSEAPGCHGLLREVRVISGLERVDVITTIDKKTVYRPEAIHLAFPFNVPEGVTRMDLPFAVARVEDDQLPGACKNYFTVQRWVDVSNDAYGVTWATVDAPLVEVGAITTDARAVGWLKTVKEPSTTLYSYVMNNYWETNYKAAQEGPTPFYYALRPHGAYDEAAAQRFGLERSQPLITVPVAEGVEALPEQFRVAPPGVIVSNFKPSDDGKARILRLYNGAGQPVKAQVEWAALQPKGVWLSNVNETPVAPAALPIDLAPYEFVTLRIET